MRITLNKIKFDLYRLLWVDWVGFGDLVGYGASTWGVDRG